MKTQKNNLPTIKEIFKINMDANRNKMNGEFFIPLDGGTYQSNVSGPTLKKFLSVSPAETPDNMSAHSGGSADFIGEPPNFWSVLGYSLLATLICFPIGCFALRNAYHVKLCLKSGHKARAARHKEYARSLFVVSSVVGAILWSIFIIVLVIHLAILKKDGDPANVA